MKHKHYDIIVAWAAGKDVQWNNNGVWHNLIDDRPHWHEFTEYRIKPTPKPDFCTYSTITFGNTGQQSTMQYGSDNVKFTYDGETRKLKSAEVLK